jgi:hypothetical protein
MQSQPLVEVYGRQGETKSIVGPDGIARIMNVVLHHYSLIYNAR